MCSGVQVRMQVCDFVMGEVDELCHSLFLNSTVTIIISEVASLSLPLLRAGRLARNEGCARPKCN